MHILWAKCIDHLKISCFGQIGISWDFLTIAKREIKRPLGCFTCSTIYKIQGENFNTEVWAVFFSYQYRKSFSLELMKLPYTEQGVWTVSPGFVSCQQPSGEVKAFPSSAE